MKIIRKLITILSLAMIITLVIPILMQSNQIVAQASKAQTSKVKISKKEVQLRVKEGVTLKVWGTKSTVKWTSSDKKVASVSAKGRVYARKKGTTVITATVNKKKYTCKVTVTDGTLTDKEMAVYGWILLQDSLVNPESIQIHSIKAGTRDIEYGDGTTFEDIQTVLFDYSAQNGFGGYTRGYATVSIYPRDGEPYANYLTSDYFDGYLALTTYVKSYTPTLDNESTIKVKDIKSIVADYQEEENYEIH
ncbi:Ig-like domain-containing protein [Clostridium sp. Marseille-P299]|uniref:Ig-like domain-containing protein n=1 Tax=Clostridium sp. Marseille-P299 TaxID=1805477 RepID=UPI00082B9F3F|nr:Ig-like domain-containing protein [Clostridium sp. Marseille-P299]